MPTVEADQMCMIYRLYLSNSDTTLIKLIQVKDFSVVIKNFTEKSIHK